MNPLPPHIQDALDLIKYAAKGTVTIEITLNELLDQRKAHSKESEHLNQQITEAHNKLERAQTHLTETIINMLKLRMYQ